MSLYVMLFTVLSTWAPVATLLFALPFIRAGKDYHRAVLFVLMLFAVTAVIAAVKVMTDVPRPQGALVEALGSAFPSGHAALGFLPLGFYWSFSKRSMRTVLFVYGVLVAYSRLVLNVHYPVDVVVGATIGFAIPLCVMHYEKEILRAWHNFRAQRIKLGNALL